MFKWAVSQDVLPADPTIGLAAYDSGTPRTRVLSAEEIRTLSHWLASGSMPTNIADILCLQLATGARCGEASGLCAEEIDANEWTWTLPASRSKNGKPRVTPLVGIARDIVARRLAATSAGAFFRGRNGSALTSSHVGHALLARRLPIDKFSTHDLRRTVATHLSDMGVSYEVIAAVLGHQAGTRDTRTVVRHYVHTDGLERKRVALEAWDRRLGLMTTGGGAEGANVTPLSTARAA